MVFELVGMVESPTKPTIEILTSMDSLGKQKLVLYAADLHHSKRIKLIKYHVTGNICFLGRCHE